MYSPNRQQIFPLYYNFLKKTITFIPVHVVSYRPHFCFICNLCTHWDRLFVICLQLLNHWFNCTKIVGQIDTFLSEEGIEQAQLVGTKLQDEQFTHIFSSDLLRARNVSFISYKLFGCIAKQLEKKKLEFKKVY